MRKVPIKLSDLELWALWKLAKERNNKKEQHGVETRKIDKNVSDLEMHYIGMKAEYGVARLLGAEFDLKNTLAGDAGYDFTYKGLTIDVKLSQRDLKFRKGTFKADVVILVQPLTAGRWAYGGVNFVAEKDGRVGKHKFAWKHLLVMGWLTRKHFEKMHEIRNFGYNDVEFMDASYMFPMKDLKNYAEEKKANEKTGS